MERKCYRIPLKRRASESRWAHTDRLEQELPRFLTSRGARVLWLLRLDHYAVEAGHVLDGTVWTARARIPMERDHYAICETEQLDVERRLREWRDLAQKMGGLGLPEGAHSGWRTLMWFHVRTLSPEGFATWFGEPGHPDELALRLQAASLAQIAAVPVQALTRVLTAERQETRLAAMRALGRM